MKKKAATKKSLTRKAAKKAPAKKATRKQPKVRKKRTRNTQSIKNIKRIDSINIHGYQVHVRRGGKLSTKLFSDSIYKGEKKALSAAKKYRDNLVEEMAKYSKPLWKIIRTPRTNTGELGVSQTSYNNAAGKKIQLITVTVRSALRKVVTRKFSIEKLGYEGAVKQAVTWRKKVLKERLEKGKD